MFSAAEPIPIATGYALRARVNREVVAFPIKDGLVIGRDPSCDIIVPDAFFKQVEVRFASGEWRIYPADPEVQLRDPQGHECAWLKLKHGTMVAVGTTIFEFINEVPNEPDPVPEEYVRHSCPRCRKNLAAIDLQAKFCPHCGAPLPADCPEWPVISGDPQPPRAIPRWMCWLPRSLRARMAGDPLFFARRTTVLAYINTLFNLGLKHDAGLEGTRHMVEAMRYYRKAAQLGNLPARARLKSKQST